MKAVFFLFFTVPILYATSVYSQSTVDSVHIPKIDVAADSSKKTPVKATTAVLKTGEGAWSQFLKKNIDYNTPAFNYAPTGIYTVKIKFTIFPDGHLGDFIPLTHYGYGMEEEVIRVLKKSKPWTPGVINGQPVSSTRIQPVTFGVENRFTD